MAANEIHQNDIGTVFEVTLQDGEVVVDISTATTKEIVFRKPNAGAVLTRAATFKTDGTDGILQYVTVSGDLDTVGEWHIQSHVIISAGEWRSDIGTFDVLGNL